MLLDSGSDNILLFVGSSLCLGLLVLDGNDKILACFDLIELLFVINQFERLGPVELLISLRPHIT